MPKPSDPCRERRTLRDVKGAHVWVAYGIFIVCMIASVASYLWSSDYFWWPLFFSAIGMAAILPVLFGPSVRVIISAFKD